MSDVLTDAMLVRRCRAGDERAWSELVERFGRYVLAICRQAYRLGDADAEDVFQEAFARTYQQLDRLRDDEAFRPWLGQMTRRLCIDRLRASAREQVVDEISDAAETDPVLARLDEAMAVRGALATLSGDCQEILDRFFARDQSYRTIGDELGIAAGTIASRISRCLGRLRDAYLEPATAGITT